MVATIPCRGGDQLHPDRPFRDAPAMLPHDPGALPGAPAALACMGRLGCGWAEDRARYAGSPHRTEQAPSWLLWNVSCPFAGRVAMGPVRAASSASVWGWQHRREREYGHRSRSRCGQSAIMPCKQGPMAHHHPLPETSGACQALPPARTGPAAEAPATPLFLHRVRGAAGVAPDQRAHALADA